MIAPVLHLGGNRWLTVTGTVVPGRVIPPGNIDISRDINPDYDPVADAAPGDPVFLTVENRYRWDVIARSGGHNLDDLLQ